MYYWIQTLGQAICLMPGIEKQSKRQLYFMGLQKKKKEPRNEINILFIACNEPGSFGLVFGKYLLL